MLTTEQIDRLFDFCKRHHVHHYDVQLELVDHLANAIEEKMSADKNLSFEKALTNVHAGFGVLGFAGVVNARARALGRQYTKLEKKVFFSYFTLPKVAMTVCLFLLLMLPMKFFTGEQLSLFTLGVSVALVLFEIYISRKSRKRVKKQKRTLLLTEIPYYESWLCTFFMIQYIGIHWYDVYNSTNSTVITILYCIVILINLLFFVSILAFMEVISETQRLARKQYPEVFEVAD